MNGRAIVFLYSQETFAKRVKAMLEEAGFPVQYLNMHLPDTTRLLRRLAPAVVLLDSSDEAIRRFFTVSQVFQLCPHAVVVCSRGEKETLEVYYNANFMVRRRGDLIAIVRELYSADPGEERG